MKSLGQKRVENMLRSSFDLRGPKNSEEHLFGFKAAYMPIGCCIRLPEPAYVCLFLKPAYVGSSMRMHAKSTHMHVWDCRHSFKPIMRLRFSFTLFILMWFSYINSHPF